MQQSSKQLQTLAQIIPRPPTQLFLCTFQFPRYDLDAVLGQMERVVVGHLGLELSDDLLPVLLGKQPHASRAEDVEGGAVVVGGRDVLQGELQQGLQGREGRGWVAAKCCQT